MAERSTVLPEVFVHDLPVPTLTPSSGATSTERNPRIYSTKTHTFYLLSGPMFMGDVCKRHWCWGSLLTFLVFTLV